MSIKVGFQNYGSSTTGRVALNLRPVKGPGEPGLELCKGCMSSGIYASVDVMEFSKRNTGSLELHADVVSDVMQRPRSTQTLFQA